jgi:hypothetical protein
MASITLLLALGLSSNQGETRAPAIQGSESLRVQIDVKPGRHFAGEGFDLVVGVIGGGERPRIDFPRIANARTWLVGTRLKPISTSGIGTVIDQQNLFLSEFRVVPGRPGTLEIPPIVAQIDRRTGRSPPKRIEIQPVPLDGRPSEFLGGVGKFTLWAEAVPTVIRLGQELRYRITLNGPGAWGSSARPDLTHFVTSAGGLRVTSEPDEVTNEPPSRTFVYRVRPSRSGEIVLPPVAIAAFEPVTRRYATKVTSSVPVRVVEVPAFDLKAIESSRSNPGAARSQSAEWIAGTLSLILLCMASAGLAWVRTRRQAALRHGPAAARAFAARLARTIGGQSKSSVRREYSLPALLHPGGDFDQRCWEAAFEISDGLIRYLELGIERPPGAITPIEARQGVAAVTGSAVLGSQAEQLADRCDLALYGQRNGELTASSLRESGRRLFEALALVKNSRRPGHEQRLTQS